MMLVFVSEAMREKNRHKILANDSPARDDVGAEELIGGMDDADNEADEVAAEALGLQGGEVGPLEPLLVPLVRPEPDLRPELESLGIQD